MLPATVGHRRRERCFLREKSTTDITFSGTQKLKARALGPASFRGGNSENVRHPAGLLNTIAKAAISVDSHWAKIQSQRISDGS
jgi:hypothetical protein